MNTTSLTFTNAGFQRAFKFIVVFMLLVVSLDTYAQVVTGKVIDSRTKEPIPLASIRVTGAQYQGRAYGAPADDKGEFFLVVNQFPIRLVVSSVGYKPNTIDLAEAKLDMVIALEPSETILDEFVFTGAKVSEEELRSPIQVEKLSIKELRNTASFNFYDAVVNLKGVDVATQSVLINTVNARGFNSNTNLRFRQFADGIDGQAPGLGFSLGNIVGPSSLDIESLEMIPGPSTSKYGPGAFNGVLDMRTKNPFDYPGFSMEMKGASVSNQQYKDKFFTLGDALIGEVSMRYANSIKKKVGFKINGTVLSGVDFPAINYENIGTGKAFETVHSISNQGVNVVNHYGDDRAALMIFPYNVSRPDMDGLITTTTLDTAFFVSRNGYREEDLVNYQAQNVKLNGSLHFKITPETELEVASFYGKASTMITGDDRIALRDFEITQHKMEVKNENFNVLAYTTMQDAGDTYNVGRLAEIMNQTAKPDGIWFNQYKRLYEGGRGSFQTVRSVANSAFPAGTYENRFVAGTDRFDSLRRVAINSIDPVSGAKIFDQSKLYHVQGSAKLNVAEDFFKTFEVGARGRLYDPESNGTIFTDSIGNDVTNFEFGGFVEGTHEINDKLELTASLRLDKNENFNLISSQRLSIVKEIRPQTILRASLQRGQRLPNIREQFYNQNLGDVTVVGGLKDVVGQYDLQNNAFLLSSLDEYNRTLQEEVNTILKLPNTEVNANTLRLKHLGILEDGITGTDKFNGIKPETITSAEFGFRSVVEEKRLFEAILYVNYYQNFIGTTRVVKPRTSPMTDLMLAAEQANNPGMSSLFFISDNASSPIITQGLELLYDVTSDGGTNFVINTTYAGILKRSDDPIAPGFNTPAFKLNMSIGHDRISPRVGAKISWRYRSEFDWQSNFVDGTIPYYNTFDFQFTYRIPEIFTSLRLGGNNVLNNKQFNAFGGPEIKAFYYLSLNFEPF